MNEGDMTCPRHPFDRRQQADETTDCRRPSYSFKIKYGIFRFLSAHCQNG